MLYLLVTLGCVWIKECLNFFPHTFNLTKDNNMNISTTIVPTTASLQLNNMVNITYNEAVVMKQAMKQGNITYKGCVVAMDMTYNSNTKKQNTLLDEVNALVAQAAKEARKIVL